MRGTRGLGVGRGWVKSGRDWTEGGLATALSESCMGADKGATIQLNQGSLRPDTLLFAEGGARIVLSVSNADQDA